MGRMRRFATRSHGPDETIRNAVALVGETIRNGGGTTPRRNVSAADGGVGEGDPPGAFEELDHPVVDPLTDQLDDLVA